MTHAEFEQALDHAAATQLQKQWALDNSNADHQLRQKLSVAINNEYELAVAAARLKMENTPPAERGPRNPNPVCCGSAGML